MEFNEIHTNEELDTTDVVFFTDRSRTHSPSPILTTTNCCDLEDILSDAISENLQGSLRISRSQLINQELSIRPEANIESNVPEGLDLYKVIFEVESDTEKMGDFEGAAVQNNTVKEDSCRLVGGSKFYEVIEASASADVSTPSPTEKHDHMKPIESDDEVSDVDQECTVFSGVSYLGAQNISDPKSESDIQRIMKELSSMPENRDGIAVSISIPVCSQGLVVLYQADSNSVMTRYSVNRISFYARGAAGTPVASCFAFTWSHGETKESAVYRCHVFRCHIAEAVNQVSSCFAKAFERVPRSMASSIVGELSAAPSMTGSLTEGLGPAAPPMQLMHVLECTVDIKETDAKGTFNHVPKERLGFKLRGGIDKQVTINVRQVTNNVQPETDDPQANYNGGLYIERCFGILLAPGRSVKHSDMRLLEMVSGSAGGSSCSVCALWNAGESALAAFNVASGDGAPAYMSLALDLVIRGIPDPLRLIVETPVKVFPPTERFWYYSKKPLVQEFYINLKESVDALGQLQYDVASIETSGELDRSRLNLPLSLSSLLPSPLSSAPAPPSPSEPDSDGDEPLLSGTGEVSKDCGEDVLVNWAQVLRRSRDDSRRRRVSYHQLEALWEFLNCHKDIALGFNKSAQAREYSKRMWVMVAESLNSHGEGATKDWKGWSNYWVDYKAKLKRRVATLRTSQTRTGGGPSEAVPLSDIEQKFLCLLGEGFGMGLPNTQVDPFPNDSAVDTAVGITTIIDTEPVAGPFHAEQFVLESEMVQPQEEVLIGTDDAAESSPVASVQRRRAQHSRQCRSNRQPPFTQEAARRILVQISKDKLELHRQEVELLKELVESHKNDSRLRQDMLIAQQSIAAAMLSWTGPRPRALNHLVRVGVPEALRGEVWLRLAGVDQNDKLMETYRTLISKDCPFEAVIQRDIARTFPAHDYFREVGGLGQDSLLRLARAYAVYDHEVGYCQGLSFLAATLLLHMPEEQAFCLLVRLMYGYGLRELYKDGFEALYMRLHQLDRLMEEQLTDLRAHFHELGVEPHMYASQWFLTVFTARFPLPLVYHILDVFLLQGTDTLFQVAMALLSRSRKELLLTDFEGVLKFFRVTLPKKCRAEETSRQIVKLACSIKVKRLAKYQQEYEKFVKESTEKEKINVELERLKMINAQLQQDKEILETQLVEARRSAEEAQKDTTHYAAVARDYREICARLDKQLNQVQEYVKECPTCSVKWNQKDNKEDEKTGEQVEQGLSDTEAELRQRVRDLELELAQVKLAHVQAQCSNQELSHQLNSALKEMQSAVNQKQSMAPWLVRTLGSIMDAAQNRPSFQTYLPNSNSEQPSLQRQGSLTHGQGNAHAQPSPDRRVSDPQSPNDVFRRKKEVNAKRHSLLVDSNVTKEAKEINRRSHNDVNTVKNLSMG